MHHNKGYGMVYYILGDNDEVVPVNDDAYTYINWKVNNKDRTLVGRYVKDGYLVSTVFLGKDNTPVVFETMIFDDEGETAFMWRYSNMKDAKQGHETIVEMMKAVDDVKLVLPRLQLTMEARYDTDRTDRLPDTET
jgi:hypothetical protein